MILKFSSAGCNRNLQQKEAKFKKSAQDFKMSRNWQYSKLWAKHFKEIQYLSNSGAQLSP